jgi:hypothetical protein
MGGCWHGPDTIVKVWREASLRQARVLPGPAHCHAQVMLAARPTGVAAAQAMMVQVLISMVDSFNGGVA